MSTFKREERYLVVKLSKMAGLDSTIEEIRSFASGALVDCVVVESDWPEYEPVWAMLERRVTGCAAEQDGYKYRLKGKDRAWTYAKNRPEFVHEFDILPLYASPPAPVSVELAELLRRVVATGALTFDSQPDFESLEADICACLDKVKELNP